LAPFVPFSTSVTLPEALYQLKYIEINSMIDKITRYSWVFIFLFAPYLTNAQEHTKADSLFIVGNFARAALEYEREIFYGNDMNAALFGRVQCFKQMRQFDKASEELLRVRLFTLNQAQMVEYFYEKILCYYLSGAFVEAQSAIDEMYLSLPDSSLTTSTLVLQTLVYNELQQWDNARQTALLYARTFPSPQRENLEAMIEQMYAKKNLPKLKRERVSRTLAFVPGLAHIYAGYWMEGSVSFLLNSAALAFGVYEVWHGYYITGYLFGAGILSATYFGGFSRAAQLLQQRNEESIRLFNNNVKKALFTP
jgi:tetratricopeptide (TPR) repeat protein